MRPVFHVTYEIVTHESAQHADAAERGFVLADRTHVELEPHVCGPAAGAVKDQCRLTLREACELVGLVEDSGNWFTEIDGTKHYGTGDETTQSLHPPDKITAASYGRLRRLLKVR